MAMSKNGKTSVREQLKYVVELDYFHNMGGMSIIKQLSFRTIGALPLKL